ncbi:MAG: hypothetical protein IJR08_00805 [Bacilli bacterium]|nr:hypothetical protein [Bacilli bacterium]
MASFKKGFCTHCKGEERTRIFEVNKDADVCYCPHCTHAMKPKEAIGNYSYLISSYLKKASKALFESTEYLYAYQTFAYVIDLDETVKVAYFGRLLSLVYLSTLRTSKISLALQMHSLQAKLYHYQETSREYFNFLWLLLDALDQYESRMKKRIQNHQVFYDSDCIVLYLKRMDEITKYRSFIKEEAEYFVDSNKEQFLVVVERVQNELEQSKNVFSQRFVDAEGHSYLFDDFGKDGNPIINLQNQIPQQEAHNFKPQHLYAKDKKGLIRDDIYLNNLTLSNLVRISIPLAIILSAIVIAGMIVSFFVEPLTVKLLIYIISSFLLSSSLVLVILHFAWKNSLKKKYYNGTNPFIFK